MAAIGPLTAAALGKRLGEPTNSVSFHLRQLHRYGFIVPAEATGDGRENPWKLASPDVHWWSEDDMPSAADRLVLEAFRNAGYEEQIKAIRFFQESYHRWSREWQRAAFFHDSYILLTAEELGQLESELRSLFGKWRARRQGRPSDRLGQDVELVTIFSYAFPSHP